MINKFFCAATLALLVPVVLPAPAVEMQVVHGQASAVIARFKLQPISRLPATNLIDLTISLQLRNQQVLNALLKQEYDPASTNFHRFLSPQEFTARFGPVTDDYQTVMTFVRSNNLAVFRQVPGRTLLQVKGAVGDIERTFHLKMQIYRHPTESRNFYAPDTEPSLELNVPIAAISGLSDYEIPRPRVAPAAGPLPKAGSYNYPPGGTLYMGSDFRNAFAPGVSLNGTGQEVGLLELDGYTPADITAYETTAGLPNVPVQQVLLPGFTNNTDNGNAEVPLDVEMAIAMSPGLSKVVMYRGGSLDAILTEMADPQQGEGLPKQISSSWGQDSDNGTSNCLMQLAAQGQSYFYASGDSGALPVDPNGPGGTYINGAYSSDIEPYMTQVGGTDLNMNGVGASWQSETVWGESGSHGSPYGSSGGYQTTLAIPDYQKPVDTTAVGGSQSFRNVPDVAMPANYILVVVTGTNGVQNFNAVGGTSCAAPLWAAFTALVNQQTAAAGKSPVGFLNPAIYEIGGGMLYASCFHDITNGNNTWSNSPSLYYAAPGYDLCTGWGSPNGLNLINALAGFSGPIFVDFNYTGATRNGNYETPYTTMAQAVSAVKTYGTIIIRSPGSSSETMTISKPMTITALDGAATVGN